MLLLLFDAIFGFNINKKSTPTFEQLKSLIKQENWSLINTVTFLSILLSSFDFHENFFSGRICYIIIKFFASKSHRNLLKKFEVIAYIYIKLGIFWMFTILPMFVEHVPKEMLAY